MSLPRLMIEQNVVVSVDTSALLEYLRWHATSGHLAFMPIGENTGFANAVSSGTDGYRYLSITVGDTTFDNWRMIGYKADYDGYVDVIMGRELYKDGPTELVRIDIYGPADCNAEPLKMLGLTHAPIYEVSGLSDLWTDWRQAT